MTATGTAPFNVKASVSDNPVRWLTLGGVLLIAAIAIGTMVMVGPGTKTSVRVRYDNPKDVGADRIANALAAFTKHGGGTAEEFALRVGGHARTEFDRLRGVVHRRNHLG